MTKTQFELALAIAVNFSIVYMIFRVEAAKIRKHADWRKKLSEYYEDHPPTPPEDPE